MRCCQTSGTNPTAGSWQPTQQCGVAKPSFGQQRLVLTMFMETKIWFQGYLRRLLPLLLQLASRELGLPAFGSGFSVYF